MGGASAIAVLREAASTRDGTAAILALAEVDDPAARVVLQEIAKSGPMPRRIEALNGLLHSPETRPAAQEMCAAMARQGGSERALALQALESDPSVEATHALAALAEEQPEHRAEIVEMLAGREDPAAVDALLALSAKGTDTSLAGALGATGNPRAATALATAVFSGDAELRATAITGLGALGGSEAQSVLLEASKSDDAELRRQAASALATRGTDNARSRLAELSADADPQVAAVALAPMLERGDEASATRLLDMWQKSPDQREALTPLVGLLPTAQSIPLLSSALSGSDNQVAALAAAELASLGGADAERALLDVLGNPDTEYSFARQVSELLQNTASAEAKERARQLFHDPLAQAGTGTTALGQEGAASSGDEEGE